ncbi:MAG: S-layer homology domain-containing protein [Candidatus Ancillula sp.]|nr:S-layer homology domain-containing protein [Candidatus Ancillula sp.]
MIGHDGNIHYYADNLLTRGQAAAFLYRAAKTPNVSQTDLDANFPDAVGTQFEKEIAWLKASGFSTGASGNYLPDANIKRGEIAKLVVRAFKLEGKSTSMQIVDFKDVGQTNQYYTYIKKLAELEIINGTNGYFYPENNINRGQIAKVISKTLSIP